LVFSITASARDLSLHWLILLSLYLLDVPVMPQIWFKNPVLF
jgi:hypothetical protein